MSEYCTNCKYLERRTCGTVAYWKCCMPSAIIPRLNALCGNPLRHEHCIKGNWYEHKTKKEPMMQKSEDYHEKKADAGKPRFDLIPMRYIDDICSLDLTMSPKEYYTFDNYDEAKEILTYAVIVMGGRCNAVRELAKVYGFGAIKYEDESWKTVPNGLIRYSAALSRHLDEFNRGNYINHEDGGLLHISQVAFNCIAIMYFMEQE